MLLPSFKKDSPKDLTASQRLWSVIKGLGEALLGVMKAVVLLPLVAVKSVVHQRNEFKDYRKNVEASFDAARDQFRKAVTAPGLLGKVGDLKRSLAAGHDASKRCGTLFQQKGAELGKGHDEGKEENRSSRFGV